MGLTFKVGLAVVTLICVLVHYDVTGITLEGTDRSYARFPKWNACVNASISFEFKTTQDEGLLLYTDDGGKYDFVEVNNLYFNIFNGCSSSQATPSESDFTRNIAGSWVQNPIERLTSLLPSLGVDPIKLSH